MEASVSSFSFSIDKSVIIQAGAGAGKTTTLTKWFLDLCRDFKLKNNRYPKVVITTFTRKATQELRERLMLKAMEDNEPLILENLSRKSQVHISTIHGVLSMFLSRYSDRIGLGADFKLMDENQHQKIIKKILRTDIECDVDLLRLMDSYDLHQIQNVLIKYYESSFVDSEIKPVSVEFQMKIAFLTLTQGISKIQKLIQRILSESPPENWVLFFSGYLDVHFDDLESLKAQWKKIREESKAPRFMSKNPPFAEVHKIELDEQLKKIDQLVKDPSSEDEYLKNLDEIHIVFARYATQFVQKLIQSKIQRQMITMSDLEFFSLKIIREFPEAARVFSAEWDYWMVDEYQDTSPLQVEILKGLIGPTSHFTVGDPQQSIYLFRGARTEVFSQKMSDLKIAGQDVLELMTNYRSRETILNFINYTFMKISNSFGEMAFSPKAWFERSPSFLKTPAVRRIFSSKSLSPDELLDEEVELALAEIQELIHSGQKPEKICVLSRKNSWLEKLAVRAYQVGVDVQIHSNSQFFERREIIEALSLLKIFVNPHDNKNLIVWLRTPWMGLTDQEIILWTQGSSISFWNNILSNSDIIEKSQTFKFLFELFQKAKFHGVLACFKEALIQFQIFDYCFKLDPTGRREANLWKLVHWLADEEKKVGFNYISFIDRATSQLDLESGSEESDANPVLLPSRVHLMTIHASKGLQFDSVIFIGMGDAPQLSRSNLMTVSEASNCWSLSLIDEESGQSQPSILARQEREIFNQRELDENLRTLYVGLTRAISSISFIQPRKIQKSSWQEILDFNNPHWDHSRNNNFEIEIVLIQQADVNFNENAKVFEDIRKPLLTEVAPENTKTSVTSLISSHAPEENKLIEVINLNKRTEMIKVAQQGTEAHRMFEALKLHPLEKVQILWPGTLHQKMLQYLIEFNTFSFLELIDKGNVEWGYIYKKNNQVIQGQIDLWGQSQGVTWIVDYKTGSSRYKDKAFEQLQMYHEALVMTKQITPMDPVKLMSIYPLEGQHFIKDGLL